MKLSKLFEEVLNETLYHGSKRDSLDWDNRNPNVDYNMLGYGIYLTDDKREAVYYVKEKGKHGYIYIHLNLVVRISLIGVSQYQRN